jgi:hypothetical protein
MTTWMLEEPDKLAFDSLDRVLSHGRLRLYPAQAAGRQPAPRGRRDPATVRTLHRSRRDRQTAVLAGTGTTRASTASWPGSSDPPTDPAATQECHCVRRSSGDVAATPGGVGRMRPRGR